MALYHSARGTETYTPGSSAVIVDGILTSGQASVAKPSVDVWQQNSFEICWAFKVGNTIPDSGTLATFPRAYNTTINSGGLYFNKANNNRLTIFMGYDTSGNGISTGINLQTNSSYKINIYKRGGVIYVRYAINDGAWQDLINDGGNNATTWPPSFTEFVFYTLANGDLHIDFNHTYITVNGQPWFGICPIEVKKHQVMGPVGYTVVGSPTITDGVVSGLDNGRLTIDNFPYSSANWELVIKADLNYVPNIQRLLTLGGFYLRVSYSNWQIITNGSTVKRIGEEGDANRYPFVKLVKNGSYISVYLSTDGITYKTGLENYSAGDATDGTLTISAQYFPWLGTIDLNETYIKVNGKLWFWQPAPTKYIVKDGKLVWADPKIYIDDNGTKTYATKDIAPVPAGYTYGTTTTPSIGYVDMRTQQFTPAPEGATIGRDE